MTREYGRFQIRVVNEVIESHIDGIPDMVVQKPPGDLVICPDCASVVPSDRTGVHDEHHARLDRIERWAHSGGAVIGNPRGIW